MRTLAPSCANLFAIPAPYPDPPPVQNINQSDPVLSGNAEAVLKNLPVTMATLPASLGTDLKALIVEAVGKDS
jgi:hypothetical protein